jgi:alcohol dehydrogenase class IV
MDRFFNPVRTILGRGASRELKSVARELGARKVLVVEWSESVAKLDAFRELSSEAEVRFAHFSASNPTVEQLFSFMQECAPFQPDLVAGVGGGSVMDVAKSTCAMGFGGYADAQALREAIASGKRAERRVPWVGIPTTAGTGSEVTCWATIWDPSCKCKRSIEDHGNYAYAALVDADLSSSLPLPLAVSSALDAMAHAVEAYWSKSSNAVSRALALAAIRTIRTNIEDLADGKAAAHDAMAQGSLIAGLAFSGTHTTACHSISYPLTMRYRIPHGAAVAMLLGPVLAFNRGSFAGEDELLEALNVKGADELAGFVRGVMSGAGLKPSLSEWGASEEDLAKVAPLCLTKGRADNNPALLTVDAVGKILKAAF